MERKSGFNWFLFVGLLVGWIIGELVSIPLGIQSINLVDAGAVLVMIVLGFVVRR